MFTKKQKNIYISIIIAASIIFLIIGLYIGKTYLKSNDNIKENNVEQTNNNYYKELYYTENGRNIYIYGKDRIIAKEKDLILNENVWNAVEDLKSEFEVIDTLKDGGTTIYRTKGNSSEIEKYTMITCNTLEGNNDIYFGPFDMEYQQDFCKTNTHEPFIKTYNVLNVAESNEEPYLYITIRGFNQEDVQTMKIKKYLCPDIQANSAYEFTFKLASDITVCDTMVSIFKNTELIKIEHIDKQGLEQINEDVKN